MSAKLLGFAVLFCSVAYASSNTPVGTVSVRGNIRVDGNQVTTDATLFDGSTVETQDASATVYLGSNSSVIMAAGSRSIVHDGYVTLEQGQIDLKPTCGFVVETGQLRITPNSPDSHGVISASGSSVSLTSQHGEFFVLDKQGRILNTLHSGNSQSFSSGQMQSANPATYVGTLSILDNHHLLTLLAPDTNVAYEIRGHDVSKLKGSLVQVNGAIDPKQSSVLTQEVMASTKASGMCTERTGAYPWLVGGAIAAGAGTAAALAITNHSPTPASR